ncbi:MAG TPA: hypothetical protein VK148_25960 [Xanthobacteraceae bacterium]|jgi:hypothetical protein|nr:hypothetical protein [Xanthobacteraceae bacterium]
MTLRDTKLMPREPRKLVRTPAASEPADEPITQRRKAETGQFRLQVDRQTKSSYATFEAAKAAALAIKKGHPNLQVAVHDGLASVNTMIELPGA